VDPETLPPIATFRPPALQRRARPHVIILVSPFVELSAPLLGPSLLAAACLKRNIDCHVLYANLLFAAEIGLDHYQRFLRVRTPLVKESLFAPYAFGSDRDKLLQLLLEKERPLDVLSHDFLHADTRSGPLSLQEYLDCARLVPAFLDRIVANIVDAAPEVLGFSLLSEQNTAALAIAKRVKEVLPHVITVIGGSNVARPIGPALLAVAPMIDYAFSGHADEDFPRFCADLLAGNPPPVSRVIDCHPADDLDHVAIPDYADYFRQVRALQQEGLLPGSWPEVLPFESSRGCWWGERRRCAFCGLNPGHLTYQRKTTERIATELAHLKNQYGVDYLYAVDNVIPDDLEDALADIYRANDGIELFYEVRSSLSPARLDGLVRAGVARLQPGIESLSSHVLARMRKGVTALQNLKFLRETCSRQLSLVWNFLVAVPGETRDDYERILGILPAIEHFQPPIALGPIRLHRYSPYLEDPGTFGIHDVKPLEAYSLIYPAGSNLEDLAFYFTGEYESVLSRNREIRQSVVDGIRRWAERWRDIRKRPRLARVRTRAGAIMIMDTRTVARETFTSVDDESSELLDLLNEPGREEAVPDSLKCRLPELLERRFVISYEDRYLSLVTDPFIGASLRRQREAGRRGPSTTTS